MKKIVKICMVGITSMFILGACSFGKKEEPRNGALLIGEEEPLKEIVTQHKSEIKTNDLYKIKRTEMNGKQVIIMNKQTAIDVAKKGLLRKSDNEKGVNSSDPIQSLPSIPEGKAVMFTGKENKNLTEIKMNEKTIHVQYAEDTWIGHDRTLNYEDIILIVENSLFEEIPVTETHMEVIEFKKSYGEDKPYNADNAEAKQAENEWNKLIKDMKQRVNVLDSVSITK